MKRWQPPVVLVSLVSVLAIMLVLQSRITPAHAGVAPQVTTTPTATMTPTATTTPTPHLELAVDSPTVLVGSLITLHITYVNLGLPYTTVTINPTALAQFDPPMGQPCKYDQNPTGCTTITFRALAAGAVTFRASATGEIFDPGCSCYRFGGGSDNGPATVMITSNELKTGLSGSKTYPSVHGVADYKVRADGSSSFAVSIQDAQALRFQKLYVLHNSSSVPVCTLRIGANGNGGCSIDTRTGASVPPIASGTLISVFTTDNSLAQYTAVAFGVFR